MSDEKHFNFSGFDPIESAEIMTLLGVDSSALDIAHYRKQLTSIIGYFKGNPNTRTEILGVLAGKSGNKMEVLWGYAQLQQEKAARLNELDINDFDPEVATEIVSGYLSEKTREKILKDIEDKKSPDDVRLQKYSRIINEINDIEDSLKHY